jgi:hypothetical protein
VFGYVVMGCAVLPALPAEPSNSSAETTAVAGVDARALRLSYTAQLLHGGGTTGTVTIYASVVNTGETAWTGCLAFVPQCCVDSQANVVVKLGTEVFSRDGCWFRDLVTTIEGFPAPKPQPCEDVTIPAGSALAETLTVSAEFPAQGEWTDVRVHTSLRAWTEGAGIRFVSASDTTIARVENRRSN